MFPTNFRYNPPSLVPDILLDIARLLEIADHYCQIQILNYSDTGIFNYIVNILACNANQCVVNLNQSVTQASLAAD